MNKQITVQFDGKWVMKHRNGGSPIDSIVKEVDKIGDFKLNGNNFSRFAVLFDSSKVAVSIAESIIKEVIQKLYPEENLDEIISFNIDDYDDGDSKKGDSKKENKSNEDSEAKVKKLVSEINKLSGAEEFKKLIAEIVKIAPEIKSTDIFVDQNYLFSIEEGCGLTTYLNYLIKIIDATGLGHISSERAIEERLGVFKDDMSAFEEVFRKLSYSGGNGIKVMCIDISEWMGKTDNRFFKLFLKEIVSETKNYIFVFRAPFVDKDVLENLRSSIADIMRVRTVSFSPLTRNEIKEVASKEILKYGFKVSNNAWDFFQNRITEEKSDGQFYGLNTVKKVVKELLYNKYLDNAGKQKKSMVITKADMQKLCVSLDSELSAYEQLNRLVGNEALKKRIEEIIAQIELAQREYSDSDRPCIHMRFVGNPGTGKTTVARIVGKLLKEKGVLRVGNFYEYAGRDLCGRYIGETAPKTASICRDAYGSVLFIDEAYSLYRGDGNDRDYGREALDTLIAEMENHRDDFVVIMAGYTDDMEKLLKGNTGLASRMPYTIEFPNFTREQLYEIFVSMVSSKFKYDDKILDAAKNYFNSIPDSVIKSKEFANARFVRNLFERIWAKAAMRCEINKVKTVVLCKDDFDRAIGEKEFAFNAPQKTRIGF